MAAPTGNDRFYAIALEEGDLLTASVSIDCDPDPGGGGPSDMDVYVVEACDDAAICLANSDPGRHGSLFYQADRDKTVFIAVTRISSFGSITQRQFCQAVTNHRSLQGAFSVLTQDLSCATV